MDSEERWVDDDDMVVIWKNGYGHCPAIITNDDDRQFNSNKVQCI